MGDYDHKKFRQIMVDADVYLGLDSMRRTGDTFGDVIRRLLSESSAPDTKKGRPAEELFALAKVARHRWQRKMASGRYIIHERAP